MKINQAYLDIQLWKVLENELLVYFKNESISEDDVKNLTLQAIISYKEKIRKTLSVLILNPTEKSFLARLKKIKTLKTNNRKIEQIILYYLESSLDIKGFGHTDAWISIMQLINDYENSKKLKSFKLFKIDCLELFESLIEHKIIDKNSLFNDFKCFFDGSILHDKKLLNFSCPNNSVVYLFDQLHEEDYLSYGNLKNKQNVIIQRITGIKNIAQIRHNNRYLPPKNALEIDKMINALKVT